jgi:hypothetical protein
MSDRAMPNGMPQKQTLLYPTSELARRVGVEAITAGRWLVEGEHKPFAIILQGKTRLEVFSEDVLAALKKQRAHDRYGDLDGTAVARRARRYWTPAQREAARREEERQKAEELEEARREKEWWDKFQAEEAARKEAEERAQLEREAQGRRWAEEDEAHMRRLKEIANQHLREAGLEPTDMEIKS